MELTVTPIVSGTPIGLIKTDVIPWLCLLPVTHSFASVIPG